MNFLAVGIGAGLVSALLFGVVITGSPLAIALSVVAPLPIFIAALGWNHRSGLVASAAGGIAMGLALNVTAGVVFALGWALPAWWLAFLALLGRPAGGTMEWYPLGRLLLWIVATSALITLIGVVAIGDGSYDTFQTNVRKVIESFMRAQGGASPPGELPNDALSFFVAAMPLFFAFQFVLILALNLWLAAKTVQVSGRLARPWPFIPGTAMPTLSLALLAASVALAFLPGLAGAAGLILAGALASAFMLQGLAFIHVTSGQRPGRGFLLGGVYALALVLSQVVLPLLAMLGLADVAFSLRNRFGPGRSGPKTPST
jgi:hypothetical protein